MCDSISTYQNTVFTIEIIMNLHCFIYIVCYREIHHFCVLLGYGADAICPYLVFETVANQRDQGTLLNY